MRTIYFLTYAASGHVVTLTAGAKLRDDVAVFLAQTSPAPGTSAN